MTAFENTRQVLLKKRNELIQRADSIEKDARHEDIPVEKNSEEQASQRQNDEVLIALEESALTELRDVDKALARIESGDYGYCSSCRNEISAVRLDAIPYTDLCIQCAK